MDLSLFTNVPVETGKTWDKKQTYRSDPGMEARIIELLLQTHFPETFQFSKAKFTKDQPNRSAVASTGGLNPVGQVNLGPGFFNPTVTYSGGTQKGLSTPEILEKLLTILHEGYHVRSNHAPGTHRKVEKTQWQSLLDSAKQQGFPSVGKHLFGGDNLEEFLATAVPLTEWERKGLGPTSGQYKGLDSKLENLKKEYPWLAAYIEENSRPEILPTVLKKR